MRGKLIKLLRKLEEESGLNNTYSDFIGEYQCDYQVEEHLDFPNYRLVVRRYNEEYPLPKHKGQQPIYLESSIKAELKRMEIDGLVMINQQDAVKYAYTQGNKGPDFDEGNSFVTESIVLTTKGKNGWRYFLHKATENPLTTLLSIVALLVSIAALLKK